MASRSKSFIFLHVDEEEQHMEISDGYMVHQWVTQGTNESIDNARRPGRGSMMRPTINEESDQSRSPSMPVRRLRVGIALEKSNCSR